MAQQLEQLDLFDNELIEIKKTVDSVKGKMETVKDSSDKVRRGIFARHDKLEKMFDELKLRIEVLERQIPNSKLIHHSPFPHYRIMRHRYGIMHMSMNHFPADAFVVEAACLHLIQRVHIAAIKYCRVHH